MLPQILQSQSLSNLSNAAQKTPALRTAAGSKRFEVVCERLRKIATSEGSGEFEFQRRRLLASALITLAAYPSAAPPSRAAQVISIEPGKSPILAEALSQSVEGDTIIVGAGQYRERLIVDKAVTIQAAPGAAVEIVWETEEHYESTLVCTANDAVFSNLTIRHASPSVANNYAVQLIASNAVLENCDISSATGSGVGVEGGSPQLLNCAVHDCERSGVMLFGDLDADGGGGRVRGCTIAANKQHGVIVRAGAEPVLEENVVGKNGGYGLVLQGCGGEYRRNVVRGNRRGGAAVQLLFGGLDAALLARENELPLSEIGEVALKYDK